MTSKTAYALLLGAALFFSGAVSIRVDDMWRMWTTPGYAAKPACAPAAIAAPSRPHRRRF